MLEIIYTDSTKTKIQEILDNDIITLRQKFNGSIPWDRISSRRDLETFKDAEVLAKKVSNFLGDEYIPTDAGSNVSPRYYIMKVPKVGDEVSMGFNGDYYPDGKIISISTSLKFITSSSGRRYTRVKLSGGWRSDGTWWLIQGHISEKNPSF